MANRLCEKLGIEVPSLEDVKDHHAASTYTLMIVALLERDGPMTLEEVAERFEEAGVKPADEALLALKRSRPGHPPIYRDGDIYELDVHDDQLDFLLFRLGLRPPHVPRLKVVREEPEPLPGPETPLSVAELEEAFREGWLRNWSAQRLALAVLDAHGGRMRSSDVVDRLGRLTENHPLRVEAAERWYMNAVLVEEDGWWRVNPDHSSLHLARQAVRERIANHRRREAGWSSPAEIEANQKRAEERSAANAENYARLKRVVVRAFLLDGPVAVSAADVAAREIKTFIGDELKDLSSYLSHYDFIAAENVRPLLRELGFDPGDRHLAELGPPQKTHRLNRRGRTLKITTELLIRGSCGINKPFGNPRKLRRYLEAGQSTRLRRRLESDLKSLFALYQYGRLHGAYRLHWGFVDQFLPLSWVHHDEPGLYSMISIAFEEGLPLEVVSVWAPGWKDPWTRSRLCQVIPGHSKWEKLLIDEEGFIVQQEDVQLARLVLPGED